MSATQLSPVNGAVVIGSASDTPSTAIIADFGSMDITESQAVESVAAYGAKVYDPYRGSGTPHQKLSVGAFAKAKATNTAPFGRLTAAGGASTFTVDTGTTLAGNYVVGQVRMQHARLRAAVPLTIDLDNSDDVTTTWPTT